VTTLVFIMANAAAAYSLGDISSLLFSADASAAPQSKKKKHEKHAPSPAPTNPFATHTENPFAAAAREQVAVAAQLQAESKRCKNASEEKLDAAHAKKSKAADQTPASVSNATAIPAIAFSGSESAKKRDARKSFLPASTAPAASSAASIKSSAPSPASSELSNGKAPQNGVVNGIVYKDGQRVTSLDVTPRQPPGERLTDPAKDSRTVFVGNVPVALKLKYIKRHFAPCGAVESVRMRSLPVASPKLSRKGAYATKDFREGASSCNAYVVFADAASVPAALKLNGSEMGGHHVRVDTVGGSSSSQKFNNRLSLFVGNLDYRANEEALHAYFSTAAGDGVVAVRCIRDKATSFGKGFAYVHFSTVDALSAALKLDGKSFEGRALRISRSDGKASLKRARPSETCKSSPRPMPAASTAAPKDSAAPPAPRVHSATPGGVSPSRLKKPRHVPRPGATQPTLPPRSAEAPRSADFVPKIRTNKASRETCGRWCCVVKRCNAMGAGEAGGSSGHQEEEGADWQKQRQVCFIVFWRILFHPSLSHFAGATRSLQLLQKRSKRLRRSKTFEEHEYVMLGKT
jgi:RNA recognition motif-containing protein